MRKEMIEVTEEVKIGNGIILEKGDKIRVIHESISDIADDAINDMSYWMSDDSMEDFYQSDETDQYDMIDMNIDTFFDDNMRGNHMNMNRHEIINSIIAKLR